MWHMRLLRGPRKPNNGGCEECTTCLSSDAGSLTRYDLPGWRSVSSAASAHFLPHM